MSETHTGPKLDVGDKTRPQDIQQNHTAGNSQQQPQPNEHLQNQPLSSDKTLSRENQQHHWNDTDPQAGVSPGVTQGHADPQQEKSGQGAHGSSSTGLPQDDGGDGPPSAKRQ